MKKLFLMLSILSMTALVTVSCEKESENHGNSQTEPTENVSLSGSWVDDGHSYMSIIMYDTLGNKIDSIPWEILGTTFEFYSDSTVNAPWGYAYEYHDAGDTVYLRHEGWPDRVYVVLERTKNHLVMEFPKADDYLMGEEPVIGIELEHWSLKRQ